MICDSYILYVCPDPNCETWDIDPRHCDDHHSHPLGGCPALVKLRVSPHPVALARSRGWIPAAKDAG